MTVEIEKNQNDIRELLNNRASTKAKLQHYETTLEQIKVRRALLYKRLVEAEVMYRGNRNLPRSIRKN